MILVQITKGADGYSEGDVMTLGDAQKLRKLIGVEYENCRANSGRWRSLDCKADPRLESDIESGAKLEVQRHDVDGGKQAGGAGPYEAVARVGKKRGRPARRS